MCPVVLSEPRRVRLPTARRRCVCARILQRAEFVLGAGLGIFHWRPEALPEDAEKDIALLDVEDGIDQPLWPSGWNPG
jgi:hypothetical protein